MYHAAAALLTDIAGLIDGGANGGLANPQEMRLLYYADPTRCINITGVGNHSITKLRIGTFCAKVQLQDGRYVLMIFHEYGELKSGKTIHSKIQLRDGGCKICDDSKLLGGKQCITTLEGPSVPLDFKNGLPYLKMHYPTDDDVKNLPHLVMTRDVPWDPTKYDNTLSDKVDAFDPSDEALLDPVHPGFNQFGESNFATYGEQFIEDYGEDCFDDTFVAATRHSASLSDQRRVPSTGELLPDVTDPLQFAYHVGYTPSYHTSIYSCYSLLTDLNIESSYLEQAETPLQYCSLRKYFLNVPAATVRHTFDSTTRHYRYIPSTNHLMTFRSPYPALNVFRRHEIVFTDTVFADVPAWGGIQAAQVFAGKMSRYVSVHGCKTDAQFAQCLEDEIRKRGAMDKLGSDLARAEISKKVKDILRTLFIEDWQSEAYFHHQLFVERMIQELKKFSNWVLNWSDAPPEAWFSVFEYVTFIMNRTAKETLDWRTPVEALTGQTPDISMLLHFTFWEPVFIKNYQGSGKNFPSESNEIIVRFIGFSEDIGHSCTFK
eukprot:scaffold24984_cov234-Skeletonema_dohrnii-CCMP3373.AAC.1